MFDKLRKTFSRAPRAEDPPVSQMEDPGVSRWASTHGFAVAMKGPRPAVQGKVGDKRWVMEVGKPTRNYIATEEIRGRAELGLDQDIALMVMNRTLKEALEGKAYSMITNDLQTTADPNLPEEMRWLAMYEEVGWENAPRDFWRRYAVLADNRNYAQRWLTAELMHQLLEWPQPSPAPEVPFTLLVLRGKGYLRMEYSPAELSVLQHAAEIFSLACTSAVENLSTDLPL